jgi:hypothetical protein
MALNKQVLNLNFAQGLDTKNDPKQVQPGKMLALTNTIFQTGGMLQKRNGFNMLSSLPNSSATFLTTFNQNLTALGDNVYAYLKGNQSWVTKGELQTVDLSVMSMVRDSHSIKSTDSATATNGFTCIAYQKDDGVGHLYYAIIDSTTGQSITPESLVSTANNAAGKVFVLGKYFIIVYTATSGTLKYRSININNPTSVSSEVVLAAGAARAGTHDGYVTNNSLYLSWGSDTHNTRVSFLNSFLVQGPVVTVATGGFDVSVTAITADISLSIPNLYIAFSTGAKVFMFVLASNLTTILGVTAITDLGSDSVNNLALSADNAVATVVYDIGTGGGGPLDEILYRTCTLAGTVSAEVTLIKSLGLYSKPFILNNKIFLLATYTSSFQPTYFLLDLDGNAVAKIAYSNGASSTAFVQNISVLDNNIYLTYLFKTELSAINSSQGSATPNAIYAQTGINLMKLDFNPTKMTSEIGSNLHLSGGFLWAYDGSYLVEQNFHLWPDYNSVSTNTSGGNITAQQYYYVVTYEWTDAQGNIHRSAPSIPIGVVTTGSTSTNTLTIKTLNLTYKNEVRIVIYRWSATNQIYYRITSITSPLLNDKTTFTVQYVDTAADSTIVGNDILYTTGGVIENIGPPATNIMALYKSRLFLVDAESPNLLWYSKQVIQSTPVEMSDLFTLYVAPTTAAQSNTGEITALSALDDKLIIFKKDAIYYLVGNGPDNTGANNDFSEPQFISSVVGCNSKNSIVFTPNGLMFQSDKGIWLLDRNLGTQYIGAPVEAFNNLAVLSAVNIPGTNQVRFTLEGNITLMYDYYYDQWGTFTNIPSISSTLYQNVHTFIDGQGRISQENIGSYLDGSNPVLMSFTTAWFSLNGLQGFQRAYYFYLLATYYSPHKITIKIAYDYDDSTEQTVVITPDNRNTAWGSETVWGGGSVWGGSSAIEQWRVFLNKQKCQSFRLTVQESYDASIGGTAGAGFTMSGIALVVGQKKGYTTLRPSRSAG